MPVITPFVVLCACVGLALGDLVVFLAPRIAAHRTGEHEASPPTRALVPLVGGWIAGRRPMRSAGLQLFTAALCWALAAHYGFTIRLPLAIAYCLLLIAIAYIDLEHRLVLNRLSYPGIVLAIAASWLWPGVGLLSSVLGAVTALLVFGALELVGRGRLGTGDTKLAILIGAMRGLPGVLNALGMGVLLGGLGAAFFLIVLRRGRKEYMAYAPYLTAGALLSFFVAAP